LLSLIVLGGAVAEFMLWPRFANSTFFLLALLSLTEFLSGIALHVKRTPAVARGARREAVEVRPQPADFHASAPSSAAETVSREPVTHAPTSHEPVSHEPVGHAPAEPTFGHPETTAVTPTPEAPPVESKPG
jgi:cell division septation protein DedD